MNVTHRFVQFNGTATKPRLSVFCSNRQLYAVLADDHNKKVLFYGSTLQTSICGDPPCSTVVSRRLPSSSSSSSSEICITAAGGRARHLIFLLGLRRQEAARRVGEELVRACEELGISEISSYDRNGFARGEKMMAFEVPVSQHGFLPR
jgi:ribosomal protein L18